MRFDILNLFFTLLESLLGFPIKPCNPFINKFYKTYPVDILLVGETKPDGSYNLVIPSDCGHSNDFYINGIRIYIDYVNGMVYLKVGSKEFSSDCSLLEYRKMVYILLTTQNNPEKGLFEYFGKKNGKEILHFLTIQEILKKRKLKDCEIWRMEESKSPFYYVWGKPSSYIVNITQVIAILFTSILFIYDGWPIKTKKVLNWVLISFCIISVISIFFDFIVFPSNNNLSKIEKYQSKFKRRLLKQHYERNLLTQSFYCSELEGRPVNCSPNDFMLNVSRGLDRTDYNNVNYFLIKSYLNKIHNFNLFKEEYDLLNDQDVNFDLDIISGTVGGCKYTYKKCPENNLSRIITIKVEGSILNKRSIVKSSTLEKTRLFLLFLKIYEKGIFDFKGKSLEILELLLKRNNMFQQNRIDDINSTINAINARSQNDKGSLSYFGVERNDEISFFRHCDSIERVMNKIIDDDFGFEIKFNEVNSWVLGITLNGIKTSDLEILKIHNVKFFGGNHALPYINEVNAKVNPYTPGNLGNAQWKKYQVDFSWLMGKMEYVGFKKHLDKRYKKSSWLEEFYNNYIFSSFKETGKSEIINDFIKEESPKIVGEIVKEMKKSSPSNNYSESEFIIHRVKNLIPQTGVIEILDLCKEESKIEANKSREGEKECKEVSKAIRDKNFEQDFYKMKSVLSKVEESIKKGNSNSSGSSKKSKNIEKLIKDKEFLENKVQDMSKIINDKEDIIRKIRKEISVSKYRETVLNGFSVYGKGFHIPINSKIPEGIEPFNSEKNVAIVKILENGFFTDQETVKEIISLMNNYRGYLNSLLFEVTPLEIYQNFLKNEFNYNKNILVGKENEDLFHERAAVRNEISGRISICINLVGELKDKNLAAISNKVKERQTLKNLPEKIFEIADKVALSNENIVEINKRYRNFFSKNRIPIKGKRKYNRFKNNLGLISKLNKDNEELIPKGNKNKIKNSNRRFNDSKTKIKFYKNCNKPPLLYLDERFIVTMLLSVLITGRYRQGVKNKIGANLRNKKGSLELAYNSVFKL